MVKRRKDEDIAGVLEFQGRSSDDPDFVVWLADHREAKGGKIRVAQGGTGVRVMFSDKADMALWSKRANQATRGNPSSSKAAPSVAG